MLGTETRIVSRRNQALSALFYAISSVVIIAANKLVLTTYGYVVHVVVRKRMGITQQYNTVTGHM